VRRPKAAASAATCNSRSSPEGGHAAGRSRWTSRAVERNRSHSAIAKQNRPANMSVIGNRL
jgi:hypothetical protein